MKRSRETRQHRSPHHQSIRDKTINRYLQQYAEAICQQMPLLGHPRPADATLLASSYAHVLVIPAFDEPIGHLEQVLPSTLENTLVIVVVNAAEDSDRAAIERTQQLWHSFQQGGDDSSVQARQRYNENTAPGSTASPQARYRLIPHSAQTTVLAVDCCMEEHQLPPNQGVGLARKIGGDIALTYMSQGIVKSEWIHYTDADVVLPDDFFQMDLDGVLQENTSFQTKLKQDDIAVVLYPFRHQPPHRHILLYELSLRYYVTELAAARSPYAFHTIGSLMCVNGVHYAKVRGFPKRKAAEDFYMLNKLAKTGAIVQLHSPVVQLASRLSHRVPFGTGAMMTKLTHSNEFVFYHPAIFQHVREWMDCIDALWPPPDQSKHPPQSPLGTDGHNWLKTWFAESQWREACWIDGVVDMGLAKTLKQAYRQSRDRHHFRLYLWTWFDAFRTLKFVHYLRDHHYPSLTVEEWVNVIQARKQTVSVAGNAPLIESVEPIEIETKQLDAVNQYFRELEETLVPMVGPTISVLLSEK